MNTLFPANTIVELQDERTRSWHVAEAEPCESVELSIAGAEAGSLNPGARWLAIALSLVVRQHRANFDLWHIEDEARAPGATDAELAAVKRRIDVKNQERNDLMEELDRFLIASLTERGLPNEEAPLNSESPGLIIDRLSILSLKIYHTREEAERADAPEGHAQRNRERLSILEEQRADLAGCLDALWRETLGGRRRIKLYRQLKMYNDPALNPAIYRKGAPK
ncbi:MAG TPA: DUF4254 domain-containing protein [Terracidiphilus sp.]|nr:DUF4254 domain-containing protein [Terracidiphilus sp.]